MKKSLPYFPLVPIFLTLAAFSCSTHTYKETDQGQRDGKYDSEFPDKPGSVQLEQISESVCTINCIASYKTYPFNDTERVTMVMLNDQLLSRKSPAAFFSDNSVRGTATVIANDGKKIALLTCAHVVSLPDTVVAYYFGPDKRPTKLLRSVSIKMKQFNFISPFPEDGSVDIVLLDVPTDIAIVGRTLHSEISRGIPVFHYPLGRAKELGWGTFVYVFSYPAGVKMVTKGIVSSPRKDSEGSFYIDAALGSGSSGGIALAIRDGIPNFELVGMVKVVPAKFSYFLAPREKSEEDYNLYDPYTGDVFVRKRTDLELGVTKCIPAESIRDLLESHKDQLEKQGNDCSGFRDSK